MKAGRGACKRPLPPPAAHARLNRPWPRPAAVDVEGDVLADADDMQRYLVLLADAGGG